MPPTEFSDDPSPQLYAAHRLYRLLIREGWVQSATAGCPTTVTIAIDSKYEILEQPSMTDNSAPSSDGLEGAFVVFRTE